MTAFARVQKQLDSGIFCWEIKSVNHRYLELSFRLPEMFRFLETSLRAMMRGKISRGKIECQLKFQDLTEGKQPMAVNESLVNGLIETANQLSLSKKLTNDLSLSTILNWPGVLQITQADFEIQAKEAEEVFLEALEALVAVREVEGQALKKHITTRLEKLNLDLKNAKQQTANYTNQTREKLETRLKELQIEVDKSRLEQEVALILTRLDVSEELDRLETHIAEVAKTLNSSEASGRRLDFLMQELNREANTLSSKSDSASLTKAAVEMKVLIEQMREQIQNIE